MVYYIDPERDQFEAFKELPRTKPIMMLNFLRFRNRAVYVDDSEVSGREAYAAYGREASPIFRRVGGEIIWRGTQELMLIGPKDKSWDLIFVARYPTAGAFLEMVTDPHYRHAVKHRQAAVRKIGMPPIHVGMPEKVVNNSYAPYKANSSRLLVQVYHPSI